MLYDVFSALVHSRGTGHDVTLEGSTMSVHHPHDPTWFEMIAYFATNWHLMFLMTAAKWHAPEMIVQLQQLHSRHKQALASLEPHSIPNLLASGYVSWRPANESLQPTGDLLMLASLANVGLARG